MENLINKKVICEKITDDKFNGKHPNGIDVGHIVVGVLTDVNPVYIIKDSGWFRTSLVQSVEKVSDTEFIFKTMNSIYRIKKY